MMTKAIATNECEDEMLDAAKVNKLQEKHVIIADNTICCIAALYYNTHISCVMVLKAVMVLTISHNISTVTYIQDDSNSCRFLNCLLIFAEILHI